MESFSMNNEPSKDHRDSSFGQSNHGNTGTNSEKSKREGAREIVNRFFHYTTINGLQRLASAKTILGRLFWILVVLGAFGMFSKDIYDLINQYLERPVTIVSKIEYFRTMNFPAVTVCNANIVRKNSREVDGLQTRIQKRNNNTCFREDLRNNNPECEDDKDEFSSFDDEIEYLLATTNETKLKNAGHHFKKLVAGCRFSGLRCRNPRYWTQFWDPKYGNCYTFNSRLTGHQRNVSLFRTRSPGSFQGLKLEFNIQLNEYIPEITRDSGIKLTVTEPNEMPFPIYQSLSLAPGFQTEIALKRVHIHRVDRYDNGSCRTDKLLSTNNNYRVRYNATYSVQACLQHCYSRSQIERCGCAEYAYFTVTPPDKICDPSNKIADECVDNWKDSSGSCDFECRDPCDETIYESSVTFTEWPSPQSVATVLDSLGEDYDQYNRSVHNVRSNFLAANIFFERFRETKVEESLEYGTANLLADIGGQIGLWAGLSVISMCELLELLALLVRYFLRGQRQ